MATLGHFSVQADSPCVRPSDLSWRDTHCGTAKGRRQLADFRKLDIAPGLRMLRARSEIQVRCPHFSVLPPTVVAGIQRVESLSHEPLASPACVPHLPFEPRKAPTMIPIPTSAATASHYTWGSACDGWHLVKAAALSVIEERMPPGTAEVRHWHARARQFFYVLGGTLTIEVEGATHVLDAGHGLELPSGTAHQARNEAAIDVRFLVISSPPHQGDRREAESDDE